MAASPPAPNKESPAPKTPESSQNPVNPPVKSEIPATDSKETPDSTTPRSPEPVFPGLIVLPSYARWFSWNEIHEIERRFLPEFFDEKSPSKNARVYKYYRDTMIKRYRDTLMIPISFTEVRRSLVGDVGSIRRVFDFLEGWGLINYNGTHWKLQKTMGLLSTPSSDSPMPAKKERSRKLCGGCKSVCSIACFASDKVDLILCSRCFVRGNYQLGLTSTDFKRVDISEETKIDWSDKETLHLLEATLQYGDDWKKVSEHVGSRSEKECVARFIRLPFGEQFLGPSEVGEVDKYYPSKDQNNAGTGAVKVDGSSPTKRRRLTPLADASNPILAQAAFLSAVVGSEVAEAAARAAVIALSDPTNVHGGDSEKIESLSEETKLQEAVANGHTMLKSMNEVVVEAQALLEEEEQAVEQSISNIIEVQMKDIQERIIHFENLELQMEKEWLQLEDMKYQLFADQQTLLQQKKAPSSFAGSGEREKIKTTVDVT